MTTQAIGNIPSNTYDFLPMPSANQHGQYEDLSNIRKEAGWHYIEGEEARVLMEEMEQYVDASNARAVLKQYNGYDDIRQIVPVNNSQASHDGYDDIPHPTLA